RENSALQAGSCQTARQRNCTSIFPRFRTNVNGVHARQSSGRHTGSDLASLRQPTGYRQLSPGRQFDGRIEWWRRPACWFQLAREIIMSTSVRWLGHSALLLESDGRNVLIDPFLTGNPKAAARATEVPADLILISHGHGDHVGDAVAIAQRTGAMVAT